MSADKLYVRVTMNEDGRTAKRELMLDGRKLCELSYVDLLEFILQATSSLRWEQAKR